MKKLGIILIVLVGFSVSSFAQKSVVTAVTSSAKIIAPLTATKSAANLDFGSIVPGTAGTVVISTAATAARTPSAGINCIGTFSNVAFTVTGEASTTYSVTYPATVTLTSGENNMVATLACSANATGNPIATGTFYLGASLAVGATQATGSYTNTGFNVTVSYE